MDTGDAPRAAWQCTDADRERVLALLVDLPRRRALRAEHAGRVKLGVRSCVAMDQLARAEGYPLDAMSVALFYPAEIEGEDGEPLRLEAYAPADEPEESVEDAEYSMVNIGDLGEMMVEGVKFETRGTFPDLEVMIWPASMPWLPGNLLHWDRVLDHDPVRGD